MKKSYENEILETRVIDGDTVWCRVDLGHDTHKCFSARLIGINAPESRGTEREAGKAVAFVVATWLRRQRDMKRILIYNSIEYDKYGGRLCGEIYASWLDKEGNKLTLSLIPFLVSEGLAVVWDGKGARPVFTLEKLQNIINHHESIAAKI